MRTTYVIASIIGLIWFAVVMIYFGTNPSYQNAGFWPAMGVLGLGLTPTAILWTLRRIITGSWLGRFP